ncbi:GDSL-type esterase/lipase family protein [uncultured Mucilaginibacter sp.]|uniref:GDSL-type esterase/lipase family protein n=1 Tax=uncultured Mucilaginibacter sp. TaxID=797541 RepID=UPI0025D6BD0F|nr:GDSL-type esterase/lipase family protein [uncultured Mucilaginibacter sp.]
MTKTRIITLFLLLFAAIVNAQQKVIQLYNGVAPGSENWTYNEQEYTAGGTPLVYDVSHPTLTAYLPDPAVATGTGVIICPGGDFYILSIRDEGTDVAKWLNQRGIAAFVLKYRTGQSLTTDPGKELSENLHKNDFNEIIKPMVATAVADGRAAITYVRTHAADYNLSPSRIGIVGFSAGATVTAASGFNYTANDRPDFVAPISPYVPPEIQGAAVAGDEPPFFVVAATDDELSLAQHSVNLYSKLLTSKHSAELHIYVKGGHGFGMKKQNIPTDTWIDRFGDWLGELGLLKPIDPKVVTHLEEDEKNRKINAERPAKDWAFIKKYEEENSKVPAPAADEDRVVFMGNSITEGWNSWGNPVFFTGKPYYDRGISGQTSGQMLVRFREDVINLKPKVVLIMAGINDIAENNGPSKLEDVLGNIVSMAVLAKAAHIKVVLCSVMPAFRFPWRPAIDPVPGIAKLNTMIKDYCDQNHMVYCDYFTAMADGRRGLPANLSGDGVHPNLTGYKMMEPIAEKAIAQALKGRD